LLVLLQQLLAAEEALLVQEENLVGQVEVKEEEDLQ
tara:strand:+ start:122 stop:229 length:108 start_codon:yes stop_codon:yes gene_type:complete